MVGGGAWLIASSPSPLVCMGPLGWLNRFKTDGYNGVHFVYMLTTFDGGERLVCAVAIKKNRLKSPAYLLPKMTNRTLR